jgi:hypothetical protein
MSAVLRERGGLHRTARGYSKTAAGTEKGWPGEHKIGGTRDMWLQKPHAEMPLFENERAREDLKSSVSVFSIIPHDLS